MHLDERIQQHPTWKKKDDLICNLLYEDERHPLRVFDDDESTELINSISWLNWQIAYLTEAIDEWTGGRMKWDFEHMSMVETEEYEE